MRATTRPRTAIAGGAGRMRRVFLSGVALVTCLATVTACTDQPSSRHTTLPAGAVTLVSYTSCDDLLAGLRTAAKSSPALDHPGAIADDAAAPGALPQGAAGAAQGKAAAAPGLADSTNTPAHSSTNVAEPGTDEPDLVKTDGHRIVTVSPGLLRVVDAASRTVTGTLRLPSSGVDFRAEPPGLLLSGDHALVLLRNIPVDPTVPGYGTRGGTRVMLIDLSGKPTVLSTYTVDGMMVDARQVGSMVRLVVTSDPRLKFPMLSNAKDADDYRAYIDKAGIDTWLPRYVVTSAGKSSHGTVACDAVSRPAAYQQDTFVTVASFDLAKNTLGDGDLISVVGGADLVYSTATQLYVVHQTWMPGKTMAPATAPNTAAGSGSMTVDSIPMTPSSMRTEIYQFDISGTAAPRYVAAGTVPGTVLNQYALSRWQDNLRVVTTEGDSSTVYVLRQSDGTLKQIGSVGGLGHGQRVYSVRFAGPVGYVVTFRQTDPLYTLDLRDPAHPKVTGSLEINGYSAYLHPLGDNRLIGVGQDADEHGRTMGLQVSLFDVSDPAAPTRLAQYRVDGAHSMAEFDPHAFLYWPATGLLVLPINGMARRMKPDGATSGGGAASGNGGTVAPGAASNALPLPSDAPGGPAKGAPGQPSTGAVHSPPFVPAISGVLALKVTADGITQLGMLNPNNQMVNRSLVVGDTLWIVDGTQLGAYQLSTLAPLGWI